MTPPNNMKDVRAFIYIFNYYGGMWSIRTHLLHPLTALTSPKVNFKCTDVEKLRLMKSIVLSPTTPY